MHSDASPHDLAAVLTRAANRPPPVAPQPPAHAFCRARATELAEQLCELALRLPHAEAVDLIREGLRLMHQQGVCHGIDQTLKITEAAMRGRP